MQMIPSTAKQYGISESQLNSTNPEDIKAVVNAGAKHFSELLNKNGNDYTLALAAYNGGQGAVDFVRKQTGKKFITGNDWLTFMGERRGKTPSDKPHAWQNETFDYVTNVMQTSPEDFQTVGSNFRNRFYTPEVEEAMKQYNPNFDPTAPQFSQNTPPVNKVKPGAPYDLKLQDIKDYPVSTDAEALQFTQILPEIYAAATNKVEPVWMQQYKPELYEPYQVSFQDRRNRNTATFRALSQRLTDNPQALSILAGQKYQADSEVSAEEFRTNQAITNDITNKNINLLNDAQQKNLQLADTQYVRQSQAKSKTKSTNQAIVNSISSKILQNKLENRTLQVMENLYPHFRYDQNDNYQLKKEGAPGWEYLQVGDFGGNSNSQVGDNQRVLQEYDKSGKIKKTTVTTPSSLDTENKQLENQNKRWQNMQYLFNSGKNKRFNWMKSSFY